MQRARLYGCSNPAPERKRSDLLKRDPKTSDALKWLRDEKALGRISADRARLAATAFRKLVGVRSEDEPDTVAWLWENLDELKRRIDVKPASQRSYASRVKSLLEEFQRYVQDEEGYRVMRQTVLRPHEDGRCPLSGKREFIYRLPPGGIQSADIQRISAHLWALARDFDPTRTPWGGEE